MPEEAVTNVQCVCGRTSFSIPDWMSVGIAAIALIFAVLNYFKYKTLQKESNDLQEKYNEMVNTQTLTAQGALETQVRAAISDAYKQVVDMAVTLQKDPGNEDLQRIYKSTEEVDRND